MTFEEIRGAVNAAWRDHVVNGVPATGPNEPVKREIREALGLMIIALDDGGFAAPPDWASDLASVVSQIEEIDAALAGSLALYGSLAEVQAAATVATDALQQISEIAADAPDAPSVFNKAEKDGSNLTGPSGWRQNIGAMANDDVRVPIMAETSTEVRDLAEARDAVRVDDDFVIGEVDNTLGYYDSAIFGSGSLTGLYRKWVIPDEAPSAHIVCNDLRPSQLPVLNAAASPKVVLAGDSVASNRANSWGSTSMLTDMLERELRRQAGAKAVTFINRSIGGQTHTTFNGTPSGLTVWPDWYSNHATPWLDYIEDDAPDVVVIAFGMNGDASTMASMAAIRAKIKAWTKVPDIVWATNLVPSPNDYEAARYSIADQEQRDQRAGAIRSLARYWGDGLLDFHRAHCIARDGFDPTSSVFEHIGSVAEGAGNAFVAPEVVWDFRTTITCNAYASGIVAVSIDGMQDGVAYIRGEGSNVYRLLIYAGKSGDSPFGGGVEYVNTTFTAAPSGGQVVFEFARHGDFGTLRNMTAAANYGEFTAPVWSGKLAAHGGRFQPKVTDGSGSNAVLTVSYDLGRPRLNKPSCRNSRLWGDGATDIGAFGGSGYTHPSDYMAPYVYEPVLQQGRFFS